MKNIHLSLLSFKEAFAGKPVKKIMCTKCEGEKYILSKIGFSEPDDIDKDRIKFFMDNLKGGKQQHCKINKYICAENRFIAKFAIGILNCLFSRSVFSNEYMTELYKGLWYKNGDDKPKINGTSSALGIKNNVEKVLGVPYGVTISILKIDNNVVTNLNIGMKSNYFIKCGEIEQLDNQDAKIFEQGGRCIVIYKSLHRCIELDFYEFIGHKSGDYINYELAEIEVLARNNKDYFKSL